MLEVFYTLIHHHLDTMEHFFVAVMSTLSILLSFLLLVIFKTNEYDSTAR